jgi:hypothetical protein
MADTYGKCRYGQDNEMRYFNYEKGYSELYRCPRPAYSDTGLCEFHDKEYSENNPDSVTDLFYQWINEETSVSRPIYCIGFYFPRGINFGSFKFKNSVYFSYAKFKHATSLVLNLQKKLTSMKLNSLKEKLTSLMLNFNQ